MKHNKILTIILLAVLFTSLIAGVLYMRNTSSADTPSQYPNLDDTLWTLHRIHGQDGLPTNEVTLRFVDSAVNGAAPCNQYNGTFTNDEGQLTFGPMMSTMMACPDLDQETAYFAALAAVSGYRVEDTHLILSNADGDDVLTFVPMQHAALEGTAWKLTGYNTGSAISSALLDTEITAEFADGQMSGTAGCNHYFAAFTVEDNQMTLGPAGNTEMFCMEPEGVMEQEVAFLKVLGEVASFTIEGNTLTMFDNEETPKLTFIIATDN